MGLVHGWVSRERLRRPRGDGEWREEDEDEREDCRGDEEAKHPMGRDLGDSESIGDVCGESNCRLNVLATFVCSCICAFEGGGGRSYW